MGLNTAVLELVATHCRRSASLGVGRALVAGYPDLLVHERDLERIVGTADFPTDRASDQIKALHGITDLDRIYDPFAVFQALGYDLEVVDIRRERGCETVANLNYHQDLPEADLVIDHGAIEHYFNIAQAAANLARAVRVHGFIVQHLPLNMMNHGFYNINPTWFYSFYEHSGFDVITVSAWHPLEGYLSVPAHQRFTGIPENSLVTMLARRVSTGRPGYPVQPIYR